MASLRMPGLFAATVVAGLALGGADGVPPSCGEATGQDCAAQLAGAVLLQGSHSVHEHSPREESYSVNGWWQNNWDGDLQMQCGNNKMVSGMDSHHSNRREDREYRFHCRGLPGVTYTRGGMGMDMIGNAGWDNGWDRQLYVWCPKDSVITGASSYHDNDHEDRIWKIQCSKLNSPSVVKKYGWTSWQNEWDGSFNTQCPAGEVLNGIFSEHNNEREDRRWQYRCATVVTLASMLDNPAAPNATQTVRNRSSEVPTSGLPSARG